VDVYVERTLLSAAFEVGFGLEAVLARRHAIAQLTAFDGVYIDVNICILYQLLL
jgi:hypothetical protein